MSYQPKLPAYRWRRRTTQLFNKPEVFTYVRKLHMVTSLSQQHSAHLGPQVTQKVYKYNRKHTTLKYLSSITMPTECCVPLCSNRLGGHVFPKSDKRRSFWIKAVRRGEKEWRPTKHTLVCPKHFDETDYIGKTTYGTYVISTFKKSVPKGLFYCVGIYRTSQLRVLLTLYTFAGLSFSMFIPQRSCHDDDDATVQ